MTRMDEDSYAEQPAIDWLQAAGWKYLHGPEIAPNGPSPERSSWDEVLLVGRLKAAIAQLNPTLLSDGIDQTIGRVRETTSPDVIRDHLAFHEMLLEGVPVTLLKEDGSEESSRVQLIDWENPERNDLLCANQFRVVIGSKNRRPDIVLFVNGLPLGELEVKDPGDPRATPEGAANYVSHLVDTIPALYRFVELIAVSDLLRARLGTLTTPPEHFAEWKTMDPADMQGRPPLEVLITEAFEPSRFLDLIRHFVLFEEDGARLTKLVAKYHQVDAVERAVEMTAAAMGEDGRAGIVWHSQGSGKSYTMVFYSWKLRNDPRFENPTIVGVTDRINLDDQLFLNFASQRSLAPAIQQAESIEDLQGLLDRPAGGLIFTTIHKFQPKKGEAMPVISPRRNIILMADEAHRSQYSRLAQNMTTALPHAIRIGFTATPIERTDRSSQVVFGDYISIYRMERSVEDKATVPIYYESRRVPLHVEDEQLLVEVEEKLTGEEDEAAARLVSAWTKLERIVGTNDRIERVAADMVAHWTAGAGKEGGKAMVVAMSQRIAAALTERLKTKLGDEAVTCVISAAATDDPAISRWRRSRQERKQVEKSFKDPDDPLKVVVVCDMWLTGFDVRPLYSIYIDKPMRDHGLLQAIARVNRVFRDKAGGLVVDYIGIGDDLRASLSAYSSRDIEDQAIPIEVAIRKLKEKHEVVSEFFHGIDFRTRNQLSPTDRAVQFTQAVGQVIADEKTKQRFIAETTLFTRLYKLLRANPAAVAIAEDEEFFRKVAGALIKIAPPEGQVSPETEQAVRQFVSEGLSAGEIIDVFSLAGDDRPEVSILSDEFLDQVTKGLADQPVVGIALLKKILTDEVRARQRTNRMQAKLFADELREALGEYEARQVTSADIITRLVALARQMRDARHRNEALGLSIEEAAFYDALAGSSEDWVADPQLADIARALVQGIKSDLSIDWADHESTEAAIRAKIKRLLRRFNYRPTRERGGGGGPMPADIADRILDQARQLYRYWPETRVA